MTSNNLVPVFTGQLQDQPTTLCNARNLHAILEVGRDFTTWLKERIEQYGFIEGEDFKLDSPKRGNQSGRGGDRRSRDYHLTLDMAKELAMVENNDKGRQVRRYFIEIEKKAKAPSFGLRASILANNSTPSVALPLEVQNALNHKAWLMAGSAYELCREFLARRVAYHCEWNQPRMLDEDRALAIISETTLDAALAAEHFIKLRRVLTTMEDVVQKSQYSLNEMREKIKMEGFFS